MLVPAPIRQPDGAIFAAFALGDAYAAGVEVDVGEADRDEL